MKFDLTQNNTLGLTAHARLGTQAHSPKDIEQAALLAKDKGLPLRVVGEGSNVVLSKQVEALVALMRIEGRAVEQRTENATRIRVGAGVSWHDLVCWTLENDLPGLENLAGIPGTVGAAPVQNIGAYGAELARFFHSLTAFDTASMQWLRFAREDCHFAYRQSIFKREPGRYVITEVTLEIPNQWRPNIGYRGLDDLVSPTPERIMQAVLALRTSKLPDWRKLGNAGSFFHNPIVDSAHARTLSLEYPDMPVFPVSDTLAKLSAGWLIERCGLKGARVGGAGMYANHALVLVNLGGATQDDILALTELVKTRVHERFGIELVQEPEWL